MQQLLNENMMEQQQSVRPVMHRHVAGATVEHVEPMQQQQMQQSSNTYCKNGISIFS